jgi:hypothetical protein
MTQCVPNSPSAIPHRLFCGSVMRQGSILIEVSIAVAFATFLGLFTMKASLLAISNNQWVILQTLTDAYLTRETALSLRIPLANLTDNDSPWPNQEGVAPAKETVTIGRLPGGAPVQAQLTRYRFDVTQPDAVDTGISTWRLHSILEYSVGGQRYVKSRSTLRMQ